MVIGIAKKYLKGRVTDEALPMMGGACNHAVHAPHSSWARSGGWRQNGVLPTPQCTWPRQVVAMPHSG